MPDSEYHEIPKKVVVSQTPGKSNRRIYIDDDLFPFYTYGPVTAEPRLPDAQDPDSPAGKLSILHIPIVCDEVEFVDPEA